MIEINVGYNPQTVLPLPNTFGPIILSPFPLPAVSPVAPSLTNRTIVVLTPLQTPPFAVDAEALCDAVRQNDPKLLKFLVKWGADVNGIGLAGDPPLVTTVRFNRGQMFLELLKLGADLRASDKKGDTLATIAVLENKPDILDLLHSLRFDLSTLNLSGSNAGMMAVYHQNTSLIKKLYRLGYDFNPADGNGQTPLNLCWKKGYLEIARLLITKCNTTPNCLYRNEMMISRAIVFEREDWKKLLVESGADVEAHDEWVLRKELAHVWGIDAQSVLKVKSFVFHFLLGSFFVQHTKKMFQESMDRFLDLYSYAFSQHEKGGLKEVCSGILLPCNFTSSEIVTAVAQRKFLLLAGLVEEHAVLHALSPPYLFLCDRAEESAGIERYRSPSGQLTDQLVLPLKGYSYLSTAALKTEMEAAGWIHEQDIPMKKMKGRHCSWDCMKVAAFILFSLCQKKKFYKIYTAFTRLHFLEKYRKLSKNPDSNLLALVNEKMKAKIAAKKKYYHPSFGFKPL